MNRLHVSATVRTVILLILLTATLVGLMYLPASVIQMPGTPMVAGLEGHPSTRIAWDSARLSDPATGQVPVGMRARELAFGQKLNAQTAAFKTGSLTMNPIGPFNVGGRTRAMAMDINDPQVMIAGSVSGGVWRTTNGGQDWTQVNDPDQVNSITSIVQDTRPGKTDTWYYGSGESIGNSANGRFSANYLGNGIYRSTDNGLTWEPLPSTFSDTPQDIDDFDRVWRVAIDPAVTDQDILYACLQGEIQRSDDGGASWDRILNASALTFAATDIAVDPNGIAYTTLAGDAGDRGIWRSADHGVTWADITPGFWPASTRRVVPAYVPSDPNVLYFLASTPGAGQVTNVFFNGVEGNSLWRYTYLSGDGTGAGGQWENLSNNLPDNLGDFGNLNTQGSYNMTIAIRPDDPDQVFIGSTNLYRSTDGFASQANTSWIGGYAVNTELPFFDIYENHHPDLHWLLFHPTDNDVLFTASDGGIARTDDCTASTVAWTSLNNGYRTTQFYTVAVDRGTPGSNVVTGGLQDNGSWWTNSDDPTAIWTFPSTGDGAHIGIQDGGGMYYYSRQRGILIKTQLDANGQVTGFNRMDPIPGTNNPGYLFINPFVLDPVDNNVMYLPEGTNLWRNDSLDAIPLTGEWDSISTGWHKYLIPPVSGNITALAASTEPAHRLYFGTASRRIYRMDDAHTGNPPVTDITNNISAGGYTHCIAVDPRDADHVVVVYSNYNTVSLHATRDGGQTWEAVAGNMEEPTIPPVPAGIGNGPSCRWVSIVPVEDGTVYMLGTSIGLFATDTLLGDSTTWVPQAPNTIGSVVIDMMDYRASDGFVAISTHGNGMFTTNVSKTYQVTSANAPQADPLDLAVYPNPANHMVTMEFLQDSPEPVALTLHDVQGRLVRSRQFPAAATGRQRFVLNTRELPAGVYIYQLQQGAATRSGKLVIRH